MEKFRTYSRLRNIVYGIILLLIVYFISLSLLYSFQNEIIFWPVCVEEGYCFQFEESFEEFYLTSSDGHEINVIHFRTDCAYKGSILYLHGNSKHLGYWGQYASDFLNRGYDVLALDYQGYGKSEGVPSEQAMYEDAETAYDYLLKEVKAEDIIIYGRSLGTGVASHLAKSHNDVKCLVLETPFYSMTELFESKSLIFGYPIKINQDFPNYEHLQKVRIPVYIIHGTKDELINYESAHKLKQFLKSGDRFITVEGGKHKNLSKFETYQNFLDYLLLG